MSQDDTNSALDRELAILRDVEDKGAGAKLGAYSKLCGPGWLQSAITLGGGSLASALYLGVVGGTQFLWLQPLAMIMGIIMLSAISYVTLSTGERPFGAINRHVTPILGWGWLIATIMANIVWCLPQFNLGYGAIVHNIAPGIPDTLASKLVISGILLAIATLVVFAYGRGSSGVKLFENILKALVGLVVVSFFAVVVCLTFAKDSPLEWGRILSGLLPDFSALFKPTAHYATEIAQLPPEVAKAWTVKATSTQANVIIAAFATAVGINMTFLLPYSMLKRGWQKEHRGLAIFDLSTGLFIPFLIATSCLVIAAASQFNGVPKDVPASKSTIFVEKAEAAGKTFDETAEDLADQTSAFLATLPQADQDTIQAELNVAGMMEKRSQWDLAKALSPFVGDKVSQYIFGIGVFAMAISTIIILMLINGFAICEATGVEAGGARFRTGALIAGVAGFFGPIIWGEAGAWLAIPTSTIGLILLPIAYLTFFLMMNSKALLGDAMPTGGRRIKWNVLMLLALACAGFGAAWSAHGKIGVAGPVLILAFLLLAIVSFFSKSKGAASAST